MATPDIQAVKAGMKATWMAGDFGQIARFTAEEAANFVARLDIATGKRVLDVACGTGNLSIPAARIGAIVTGVDIATNLLEQARARAKEENLQVQFLEGDAEQLAFPDHSFDLVMTMFGAMFAPRPERVAAELVRVCRPGGLIAMANWTPEDFVGKNFAINARHVPPPPGLPAPTQWGDEATVRERFKSGIADFRFQRRKLRFNYPFPPAEVVEFFRTYFGPTQMAFSKLDASGQQALRKDVTQLWTEHNSATDGTTQVEAEYLEVWARRSK